MATTVTVAVAGDPADPQRGLIHPDDFDLPYEQRPKVELQVEDDETLAGVLRRAADHFNVPPPDWDDERDVLNIVTRIDFYNSDRALMLRDELVLLDEEGHARWTWHWKDEPYSEIIRAGEAGNLGGDPRRPYLMLQPGIGNGVLPDFPTLLELWDLLWNDVGEELLKGAALAELARRAIRRARRASEPIESNYAKWAANGGRPDNVRKLLNAHAWDTERLGEVLGCSPEQAEAFLLGFGHVRGSDGLWRPGDDPESRFIWVTAHLIVQAPATQRKFLMQLMEDRLRELSDTGQVPDFDWEAIGAAEVDEDVLERLGVTVHHPSLLQRLRLRVTNLWWRIRYRD